ncbi:Aminotransferase [Mycena chlorophos]|uniref:Aminotransferase n=1 Tax=Mycena chlorophos TaxID=658473 RepID=A0A8H6TL89_MYCCL|nr:Aminotransferase [Mycena chlorophos]
MARTKSTSPKTPKASYAERVLGSFTQIQREHKRHSIHIATLRAQVQKTAAARKDKLGPNWKNWVGKAVHKLQESGVFESAEPAGSVALTPEGKKAIQSARRVLDLPSNSDNITSEEEALLWKEVVHPGSVVGLSAALTSPASSLKRRTRHSLAVGRNDDDDNDEEFVQLPIHTRKRRRISLATSSISTRAPRKPARIGYNTLTKAQLIEQITALKAAREADRLSGMRASSPFTELGDDDVQDRIQLDSDFVPQNYQSDAIPPQSIRKTSQVMRTQSGSLINMLTNRPTPAPTEIDDNEPQQHFDMQLDESEDPPALPRLEPTTIITPEATPSPTRMRGLPLPVVSPVERELRQARDELAVLQTTLAKRSGEVEERTQRANGLAIELASVQQLLEDRARALDESKASDERLRAELATLTTRINELGAEKAVLEEERYKLDQEFVAARVKNGDLSVRIASLEAHVGEVEAENAGLIFDNGVLAGEKESRVAAEAKVAVLEGRSAELDALLGTKTAELEVSQASVVALEAERDGLVAFLDASRSEVEDLVLRLAEVDHRLAEAEAGNVRLAAENALLGEERDLSAASLVDANATLDTLKVQHAELEAQLAKTTAELADTRLSVEQTLRPQLAALDSELTRRVDAEKVVNAKLAEVGRENRELKLRVELDGKMLEKAKEDVDQLKTELAGQVEQTEVLRGELATSKTELAGAVADVERMTKGRDGVVAELDEERSKRVGAEKLLGEVRETLESERATMTCMRGAWREFSEGVKGRMGVAEAAFA